jgi:hypothetical protein
MTRLSFKKSDYIGFYDNKGKLWLVEFNDLKGTSIIEAIMCFQAQNSMEITVG